MKQKMMITASAMALLLSMSALAESTAKSDSEVRSEAATTGSVSQDAKKAWKDVKEDASETYEKIKATFIDETNDVKAPPIMIDSRTTANGIIGKSVYNAQGEAVARVTDIILDKDGRAAMVVVSDGAFIPVGKKVAFDYSAITKVDAEGDVMMPISEETIDKAAPFSYERAGVSKEARVVPAEGYSVVNLLEGHLVDSKNKSVADVENISFKNGYANQVIIGFDKTLGLGGDKAALNFEDVKITQKDKDVNFQLNTKQTAQFDLYKKSIAKTN